MGPVYIHWSTKVTQTGQDQPKQTPSTRWSLVARAAAEDASGGLDAMDELLRVYRPVLVRHLHVGMGIPMDRTEDLVHGFIAERILEKNLLARADRDRGRFRSFLLKCFGRYVQDQQRKDRAQKRGPSASKVVRLEEHPDVLIAGPASESSFHLAWARGVITQSIRAMEEECRSKGREGLWEIMQGRILGPALDGTAPAEYDDLVRRFHFQSPAEASNALITAKRMFMRCLREAVRDTVETEDEVDMEIRDLKKVLSTDHAGST